MALIFTTQVGRFVQGNAFKGSDKDQQGQPRVIKTGPNAGQPAPQWFMAVAFAKGSAGANEIWANIGGEAAKEWPSLFPHGYRPDMPNCGCVMPSFAFKIVDGDGYDTTGKSNATKEGFAGHYVLRASSGYAPKVFHAGNYDPAAQVFDANALKCGYFTRLQVSVVSNGNAQKPGMYVNLQLVEIAGYGPEIVQGPDAGAAFGGGPGALPAGASATPIGGPGPLPGGAAPGAPYAPPTGPAPGYAAPPTAPPYTPAAPAAPAPPIQPANSAPIAPSPSSPAPYPGYMAGPPAAPAAPAPPAPPAPPVARTPQERMLPGASATYDAYRAANWSDDQLVQGGLMAPA